MKKRWQELKVTVLMCIGLGWWGFWYPELEQAADTYVVVLEDETVQSASQMVECGLSESLYLDLLHADNSQVKVSSKLWKLLQEYVEEEKVKQ